MNQPATTTLERLYAGLGPSLAAVDAEIAGALEAKQPEVATMIAHAGRYSGKKLRPALVLLISKAVGGPAGRHARLGAVVELIHLATLVHDDVIDGATQRRREHTINTRWSNFDAVLLGDIIFARAINLLGRLGDARAIDELTRAVSTLCEGEILQNRHRNDPNVDEALYYRIIEDKTAILYAVGCSLAAHLAGAPTPTVDAFRTYGLQLGTAFQIIDDCLDLTGDESVVGKSLGTDLRNGKQTLPMILLLARLTGGDRARAEALVRAGASREEDVTWLRGMLRQTGAIEGALGRADEHGALGLAALRAVLPAAALDDMAAVAAFVVRRSR